MPSTTRQKILREIDAAHGNLDWAIHHLETAKQTYVDSVDEFESDYTPQINFCDCAQKALLELQETLLQFKREN